MQKNHYKNSLKMAMKTPLGDLFIIASPKGIQALLWDDEKEIPQALNQDPSILKHLNNAKVQLEEYFQSKRTRFSLKLDLQGTDFQKQVWNELLKIPYGEFRSYKDIAIAINNPNASRAVGSANGANPLCIIVPCHRVITSSGEIGGYSGGVELKKILIQIEKSK